MVVGRTADAAEDDGLGAGPLGAVNIPIEPIRTRAPAANASGKAQPCVTRLDTTAGLGGNKPERAGGRRSRHAHAPLLDLDS